ncbi:MAG: IS1 family transposase, partial [Okeania sp. SIO2H7]|nr:IS1 family transposase [Okeania sp. SIO2H7]
MYVNGMGFRAIERITGVSRTTIIDGVKLVGTLLPDTYEAETMPEVGELEQLETFVGKKNQIWQRSCCWVRDGNPVYSKFIPAGDQIVSKTY